jgi:hypothetical protein
MAEVIAAIVGVLLGALVSWLLSRSRPHYLVCEDSFRARLAISGQPWTWSVSWQSGKQSSVSLDIGLPQTQVLCKEIAVDVLTVLRLKFRNAGDKIIDHPTVAVKLNESAKILGCDIHLEPERFEVEATQGEIQARPASVDHFSSSTIVEPNKTVIVFDSLYPHNVRQEVAVLDIFCSGEIGSPTVSGQGIFKDGSVWATKFEPWEESQRRTRRRVGAFNNANAIGLLVAIIAYSIWRPPSGLITINGVAVSKWASQPLFLMLAGWLLLFGGYAFYMAMRGWYLTLPIPFLKRRLEIRLGPSRKRPK